MSKKREVFISVDVETAGPIVGEHSMLTVGACLAYQPEVSFSIMLKPISDKSVAAALEVTGLSLVQAENDGLVPAEAMTQFAAWIAKNVPVSMCGDMAADPVALPLVLGLGFRRLSVPLAALPFVHETVRRVDVGALGRLVEAALAQDGAAEVRALVRETLASDLGGLWAEQGVT